MGSLSLTSSKADGLNSDCIPGTLRQLFNSSMAPAWRIVQPYCVGLAPQVNSLEPLWYVGCKVMTGEDKLCKSINPAYTNVQMVGTSSGYLHLTPTA